MDKLIVFGIVWLAVASIVSVGIGMCIRTMGGHDSDQ